MDIMSFRMMKETLLDRIKNPEQRAEADIKIKYTLNILGQETMSAEAIAVIIASTIK